MDGDAGQEILGSEVASLGDQSHCTVCTLRSCEALVSSQKIFHHSFLKIETAMRCGLNGYTHRQIHSALRGQEFFLIPPK